MLLDSRVPHNKKRNVGLVYEFIVRFITKAHLSSNKEQIATAKLLLKEHFGCNSQVIQELKVFKQLKESQFESKEVALRFIETTKKSLKINHKILEAEKTALIHEINKKLNHDGNFFNQHVSDYKTFATIQTLLNAWINPDFLKENANFIHVLEDNLISHLTTKRDVQVKTEILKKIATPDSTDKLVTNLMHKKFEEKYGTALDERQKEILKEFILGNNKALLDKLNEAKFYILDKIKEKKNYKELYEEVSSLEPQAEDQHCSFFIGVLDILREDTGVSK